MRQLSIAFACFLLAAGGSSCKKFRSGPPDEVVGAASALPAPSTSASAAINPGMADLTPTDDPFSQGDGGAADPTTVTNADGSQMLPPDKGKPAPLAVTPITISFQKGMLRDNKVVLKSDGSVSFDGKRLGTVSGNKVQLSERPLETTVRSDGYLEETGGGFEHGMFMKMTSDAVTNSRQFSTRLKPDGTIVSFGPGQPEQKIGKASGRIASPSTKRTALALIGTELARPPDFSAAQKKLDEQAAEMRKDLERVR